MSNRIDGEGVVSGGEGLQTSMRWRPRTWLLVLALWASVVGAGLWILLEYENTPGVGALAPEHWPIESRIERSPDRATLLMVAHPHCPCTRASIGELARLMADVEGRVSAYVLFLKPADSAADWAQTDLRCSAAAIPGVSVVDDEDGREGRRFGAETSGQTLLYDADGQLLFSGGITMARGHSGDNPGRSAIVSLLDTGVSDQRLTAVFGCPLHDPAGAQDAQAVCRQ